METDVVISLSQLLWLIGGITAIGAFVKWIIVPFKRLDDHEQRIKALESQHEERKIMDRYTTRALNAIVNHLIDGNGADKLREVRDEFQSEIISRL